MVAKRGTNIDKNGLMVALMVGLTVVKGGTNNDSDKDYCWQRVGKQKTVDPSEARLKNFRHDSTLKF